jgi:hypothetical protein
VSKEEKTDLAIGPLVHDASRVATRKHLSGAADVKGHHLIAPAIDLHAQ